MRFCPAQGQHRSRPMKCVDTAGAASTSQQSDIADAARPRPAALSADSAARLAEGRGRLKPHSAAIGGIAVTHAFRRRFFEARRR